MTRRQMVLTAVASFCMSKKNAGEFYTPRSVVKLMVQLLQPKSGESVYEIVMQTMIQGVGKIKKYAFAV